MNTLKKHYCPFLAVLAVVLVVSGCDAGARRPQSGPVGTAAPASLSPGSQTPPAQSTSTGQIYFPQVGRAGAEQTATPVAATTATPSSLPSPAQTPVQTPTKTPTPEPTATAGPTDTPEPTPTPELMSLADWPAMSLTDWPRPANDNGLCIHNIAADYYSEEDIDLQISRLKAMKIPWTVMLYADENQLMKAAPRFRDAGIMVIWRKMLRADQRYNDWTRDIDLLKQMGVAPYMQVYNEPSLSAEWIDSAPDLNIFLPNFISAVQQVYNAGGYVGVQGVDDAWLQASLQEIQRRGGEKVFERMFLVPHPYGLNHPPDYMQDSDSVLGFLNQAKIVSDTIGFVPPMIAGEGGWKWNATDDPRYPPVDATLHRDYHLAVFDWFRSGVLSNGQPLPDYLLAFCPWLLAAKLDDSGWYDSFAGDHTPTIDAVKALPAWTRKFSWER